MLTPAARGAMSEAVLASLRSGETAAAATLPPADDADDAQLTLWCLFELHHRGFDDVADELEWDPHLIALHPRLRAASLGFLAAFEATSSAPSRQIARGLERLGFPPEMIEYYTEHVEADAVHEQLAVRTVCGTLLEEEPEQHENVWFGAWAALHVEDLYGERMLAEWTA